MDQLRGIFKGIWIVLAITVLTFWTMRVVGVFEAHEINLSGHVYRDVPSGLLAIKGAEVTIFHQGKPVSTFSDHNGYFRLSYTSYKKGKQLERVIVSYPNHETVGQNIEVDYSQNFRTDALTFLVGTHRAEQQNRDAIQATLNQLLRELVHQQAVFRLDFERMSKSSPGSPRLIRIRSILRQQDFNIQFLQDDGLLFKHQKISPDRMLNTIVRARERNEQLILKRNNLLNNRQ